MSAAEQTREWSPGGLELFLFSAAVWLPHKIHYDRDFARSEGHRDLVVHGPLQAARLLELAAQAHGAESLVAAEFRHVSPVYVGDRVELSVDRSEAEPELLAARSDVIEEGGEARAATVGAIRLGER